MWNLFFLSLYGINMNAIHLFILIKHECHMLIRIVFYTQKLYTWLLCLNNARHSCLNTINSWNNIFCIDLKQTHETYKFMIIYFIDLTCDESTIKIVWSLFIIGSYIVHTWINVLIDKIWIYKWTMSQNFASFYKFVCQMYFESII